MDENLPPDIRFPAVPARLGLMIILLISMISVLSAVTWIYHEVHQILGMEIAGVVVAFLAILVLGLILVGVRVGFSTKRALHKRHDHADRIYYLFQRCRTFQEVWLYLGLNTQSVEPMAEHTSNNIGSTSTKVASEEDELAWLLVMEEEITRRGRTPDHSIERWARVIFAWEHPNPWNGTITLNEFLCQEFGAYDDGAPKVSKSTFYSWKKKIHQLAKEYRAKKSL